MVFPRTVLFPLPSLPPPRLQTGTDQPRISKEDPTVLFSHSLPPHKQAGTEVVPRTPGQELDCERLHPALGNLFVPHLRLGRTTWRGKPRLRTEGGHNLLEPGAQSPRVLRTPPPRRLSPFAPALPGKSLAGREGEETARQRGPPLRAVNQGFVCANLEPRGAVEGRVWAGGWARKGGRCSDTGGGRAQEGREPKLSLGSSRLSVPQWGTRSRGQVNPPVRQGPIFRPSGLGRAAVEDVFPAPTIPFRPPQA